MLSVRERDIIRNCLAYLCYASTFPGLSPVWDGNNEEIEEVLGVLDYATLSTKEIKVIVIGLTELCYVKTPSGFSAIANAKMKDVETILNDLRSVLADKQA